MTTDIDMWQNCRTSHQWAFNKLQIAQRFDYKCGPAGVPVKRTARYVVRPIINLLGMGYGARIQKLRRGSTIEDPGFFWCELFEGPHLSVDYTSTGKATLVVQGFRKLGHPLYKWDRWVKLSKHWAPPFPKQLEDLLYVYDRINIEFIGTKPIEVHLRGNPDFEEDGGPTELIPVFVKKGEYLIIDDQTRRPYRFKKDEEIVGEIHRLGFFYK